MDAVLIFVITDEIYDFAMETFAVTKPLRILQKMDNGTYDVVKLDASVTLGDAGFSNGEVSCRVVPGRVCVFNECVCLSGLASVHRLSGHRRVVDEHEDEAEVRDSGIVGYCGV